MSDKNEVFEYLIDRLRQQLPVVDVMGEIKRWSIDRSIVGRGIYTDEENVIIDAYTGLEHNPYKQQCEDLAHEVQSLKNQLRDASGLVAELQKELDIANDTVVRLRKEGVQRCDHVWSRYYLDGYTKMCIKCGLKK